MHLVAVYGWQKDDVAVAKTIAETMGTVVFEARQKISAGGPAVLANFADLQQAEALAGRLSQDGVPALLIDTVAVRSSNQHFHVRRFVLGPQALQVESFAGELCDIDYDTIELLLGATCNAGQTQTTTTETERKFSLGKTLLAGGVPMTTKVKREKTVNIEERDETLWLYIQGGATMIFNRAALNYGGLGDAMQFTRDLNFTLLKNELRRLAPQAGHDDRMIKRAALVRLLGPALNPETDLDLAFEILARSLREKSG
ncbi:MAG: hypothetical protein JRC99_02185 [Deltaproteobacteria bacterium]|nr:hypothetical protein [Deltaproteobacteria bacterium]